MQETSGVSTWWWDQIRNNNYVYHNKARQGRLIELYLMV